MVEIVFASGNMHKVEEAQKIVGTRFKIITPAQLGFDGEIPETHETIPENSEEKVRFIWNKFHKPCFADDTGLEVDALNGEPGVYSARYAGEPKSFERNVEKLLFNMQDVPDGKRTAHFRCVVSYIDATGAMTQFEGRCNGHINRIPVNKGGFGYDPVFVPDEIQDGVPNTDGITMSEMSMEGKNAISHRGKAMEKLVKFLNEQ